MNKTTYIPGKKGCVPYYFGRQWHPSVAMAFGCRAIGLNAFVPIVSNWKQQQYYIRRIVSLCDPYLVNRNEKLSLQTRKPAR